MSRAKQDCRPHQYLDLLSSVYIYYIYRTLQMYSSDGALHEL